MELNFGKYNKYFNTNLFLIFALLLSIMSISSAWGFQLIGNYIPCKLCLIQRMPYYLGIPTILLTIFINKINLNKNIFYILSFLIITLFLYGLFYGIYQSGAEWNFWSGPSDCGGGKNLNDVKNLIGEIQSSHLISCSVASWRFLGLSFAGWNVVICLGIITNIILSILVKINFLKFK